MTSADRRQLLAGLGLVDWRLRIDGPLGAGAQTADAWRSDPAAATLDAPKRASGESLEPNGSNHGAAPDIYADFGPSHVGYAASMEPGASNASAMDSAHKTNADGPATSDDSVSDRAQAPHAEVADAPHGGADRDSLSTSPTHGMDWEQLEAWLREQDHRGAQRPVFGIGARDADVLIVGEAPGAHEDEQGVPFVGRAGKLLDRMLATIGCSRATNVYITNICKFRPPNNRDPNAAEVAADWPVLERQIELMAPKLVVAVGRVAAQTLLGKTEALGKMRGRLHRYPHRELDVLVTYHPAFLLRSPQQKAKAWIDLRQIADHIGKSV